MLQYEWTNTSITTNKTANEMLAQLYALQPRIGAFDTETTGLHITLDKPFLFQFGYIITETKKGYTYTVDLERQPDLAHQVIKAWHKYTKQHLKLYLGHNVKFDLHMLHNVGEPYMDANLSDTMFYIRYAHDALTPANGGPPLGLKEYAAQYVDRNAKQHEQLLDREKTAIAKELNLKLKIRLNKCGKPPTKYTAKSYTIGVIDDIFKDPIFHYSDLPEKAREAYLEWLQQDVPIYLQKKIDGIVESSQIPYNTLNRDNLTKYGHFDIVYTLEIYLKLKDVVEARQNTTGIEIENRLIEPLFYMERTGLKANKEYLEDARVKVKDYIKLQRTKLWGMVNQEFRIGQHELIKTLFENHYSIALESTNKDELELLHSNLVREKENPEAIEFIEILQELRTLEKWYSVYMVRYLKNLEKTDTLYATYNQVGTVSGRVTSDFQQFPKKPIIKTDGTELYHPRKIINVTNDEYDAIVYLDFSQIELRFQAIYTILVGHPDLNLCRAYMPYKCVNTSGELFDCNNPEHLKNWNKEWYYKEDKTEHWKPTDVHGASTKAAFDVTEEDPEYHDLRYIGKRLNFAKNYGAQYKKICTMFPTYTAEECIKIDQAYYKAFPGVKEYHSYCYGRAQSFSNTSNLFGVKYYGVSGHKLINLLVQGSAAFYLKHKIIELYNYMKNNNIKSKLQLQVHDEVSFLRHKSELDVFFSFKYIMENWNEGVVPIIADMEVTTTTWADKKEVNNINELQTHLSH